MRRDVCYFRVFGIWLTWKANGFVGILCGTMNFGTTLCDDRVKVLELFGIFFSLVLQIINELKGKTKTVSFLADIHSVRRYPWLSLSCCRQLLFRLQFVQSTLSRLFAIRTSSHYHNFVCRSFMTCPRHRFVMTLWRVSNGRAANDDDGKRLFHPCAPWCERRRKAEMKNETNGRHEASNQRHDPARPMLCVCVLLFVRRCVPVQNLILFTWRSVRPPGKQTNKQTNAFSPPVSLYRAAGENFNGWQLWVGAKLCLFWYRLTLRFWGVCIDVVGLVFHQRKAFVDNEGRWRRQRCLHGIIKVLSGTTLTYTQITLGWIFFLIKIVASSTHPNTDNPMTNWWCCVFSTPSAATLRTQSKVRMAGVQSDPSIVSSGSEWCKAISRYCASCEIVEPYFVRAHEVCQDCRYSSRKICWWWWPVNVSIIFCLLSFEHVEQLSVRRRLVFIAESHLAQEIVCLFSAFAFTEYTILCITSIF